MDSTLRRAVRLLVNIFTDLSPGTAPVWLRPSHTEVLRRRHLREIGV